MTGRRFVVLDRDGTMIVERHYLSDPAQVELLPGAIEGMQRFQELGLGIVMVTNQSGVGRGYFDELRLAEIHARLNTLLSDAGIKLDGIYYCPHTPQQTCHCRKPEPGMLQQAAQDHGFSLNNCFVIGDKPCDIELGQRVGATTLLVRTGYGAQHEAEAAIAPHHIVDHLAEAAQVIEQTLQHTQFQSQDGLNHAVSH